MRSIHFCIHRALLGLTLSLMAGAAIAEDAASDPEAPTGNVLEEIVITAQKVSENVQDIPKPVAVVSQMQLQQAGINNLQDLSRVSPSIQGNNSGPFGPPSIRGISSFSLSIGILTKTGIVLDDIPQPTFSTLANELSDVERVEVLPGPQSTLSGRNAAGGLINIVTRAPSEVLTGRVTADQIDDHQTRITGFLSGPMSSTLGFSLSGYYNDWDGPYRNVVDSAFSNDLDGPGTETVDNNRLGGFEQRGARGKLRWAPSDSFQATLTAFYTKGEFLSAPLLSAGPYTSITPGTTFSFGGDLAALHPGAEVGPYTQEIYAEQVSKSENENKGGSLRLDFDTAIGALSSITSYSQGNQPRADAILPFQFAGGYIVARTDTDVKYTTQEFRLASETSDPLHYLFGVFYSDTTNFEPYARNILFPVDWDREAGTRSVAVFGRSTYDFNPATSATLGLRYQSDDQDYSWDFISPGIDSDGSFNYDFVTGEVSLQHSFAPDLMTYLTYANAETGKAYDLEDNGSANLATGTGLQPIDSEHVENYELGLKSQWLDHRLTANLSLFYADYTDYQVQSLDTSCSTCTPVIRTRTVGDVRTEGVELSSSFAATEDLRFTLDATYLDAQMLNYPGASCYTGQTAAEGCVGGTQTVKGPLPNTSKYRLSSAVNYTLPLASLPFESTLGAFFRYQSPTTYDLNGNPRAIQGGFGVLNLTAGIKDRNGKYSVELYANNVTDKQFYASVGQDPFASNGVAMTGTLAHDSYRYYGVRVSVGF